MKKVSTFFLLLLIVSNALSFENNTFSGKTPGKEEPLTESGTMQVRITDSETSTFGVIIEILNLEVYNEKTGWVTLNNYQQSISSAGFTNGSESLLANATVPTGTYTKLRLTFGTANTLYATTYDTRATSDLWFPSSKDQTVEVAINEQVFANATDEVLIHLNVATSVTESDNAFIFRPEMQAVGGSGGIPDFGVLSSAY